jgi:hypothetical protein
MGCSYMQVLHGGNHHGGCGRCHHIYIYIYMGSLHYGACLRQPGTNYGCLGGQLKIDMHM